MSIKDQVRSDTCDKGWVIHTDGSLWYRGRVVVPQLADLRGEILREFHCSCFAMHPGGMKNVPRSSSLVLLEWDKKTYWGFCPSMSHVSASKGCALKADENTPTLKGR